MLKRRLCEVSFDWELSCEGPLLIADGRYDTYRQGTSKQGFPNCLFISRLSVFDLENTAKTCNQSPPRLPYYVPGTSIRGPFRAQAERIIRSLLPENASHGLTACDPFLQKEEDGSQSLSCSSRLEKLKVKNAYAAACPACKLFGCAGLSSRISFTDADVEPEYSSVYRDMVGIDRFTGGVYSPEGGKGANMRFHVLENTKFSTTVKVANFELWQLGLLAYLFRDFEEGLVPIGCGKTKGFGQVKGRICNITLTYPVYPTRIEHLGSLMDSSTERKRYGIFSCESPTFTKFNPENNGLSLYQSVSVTDLDHFWSTVAPFFNAFIDELNRQAKETM